MSQVWLFIRFQMDNKMEHLIPPRIKEGLNSLTPSSHHPLALFARSVDELEQCLPRSPCPASEIIGNNVKFQKHKNKKIMTNIGFFCLHPNTHLRLSWLEYFSTAYIGLVFIPALRKTLVLPAAS